MCEQRGRIHQKQNGNKSTEESVLTHFLVIHLNPFPSSPSLHLSLPILFPYLWDDMLDFLLSLLAHNKAN